MKIIHGTYSDAGVFTCSNSKYTIDKYATAQIQMLCDNPVSEGCKIRIMPDVHPGKVGTIGLTMTVGSAIISNIVGIDIGCGMTMAEMSCKKIEFQKLDTVIREKIPSGSSSRTCVHRLAEDFGFSRLFCSSKIRKDKALLSLGSLGGGNHFIEIGQDGKGSTFVVLHSGSRHLGKEVTDHYLSEGQRQLKERGISLPFEWTYLTGTLMEQYIHDLQILQEYAELNRQIMLEELAKNMKWRYDTVTSCIHNYVEAGTEANTCGAPAMLRKGAISAKKGEPVIIPINMREGILLGTGLGNESWNCSAPHGAGRILKREDVKLNHTLSEYKNCMKGIYSPSVGKDTLDEAPFAYRSMEDIAEAICDTVEITNMVRPIYNFKAGGKE